MLPLSKHPKYGSGCTMFFKYIHSRTIYILHVYLYIRLSDRWQNNHYKIIAHLTFHTIRLDNQFLHLFVLFEGEEWKTKQKNYLIRNEFAIFLNEPAKFKKVVDFLF